MSLSYTIPIPNTVTNTNTNTDSIPDPDYSDNPLFRLKMSHPLKLVALHMMN